jgi:two-component system, response regulator PdtaR
MTSLPTILLIEDEAVIRLNSAAMLADAGYDVLEAGDASEALALLSGHPEITLVLTDVQMPGVIDGLMLVEIINQDYPAIRSVVTSGKASWRDARQCGAQSYLPKPYSAEAMEAALKQALAA